MGDVSLTFGLDAKQFFAELQQIRTAVAQVATHLEKEGERAGSGFAGAIRHHFGAVLAGLGIAHQIESVVELGDKIYQLGQRFGVSTEALQRFGNTAEKEFGISLDATAKFFQFLEINQGKALKGGVDSSQAKTFARLLGFGDNVAGSNEFLKGANVESIDFLTKLGQAPGGINLSELKEVGGRSAAQFRPVLEALGRGEFEKSGAISESDIKNIHEVSKSFKELNEQLVIVLGTGIAKLFRELAVDVTLLASEFKAAYVELRGFVDSSSKFSEEKGKHSGVAEFFKSLNPLHQITDIPGNTDETRGTIAKAEKEANDIRAQGVKEAEALRVKQLIPEQPHTAEKALEQLAEEGEEKADKKEEKKEKRENAREIRDAAREQQNAVHRDDEEFKREKHDRQRDLNPTGLTLHDLATAKVIGSHQTALAREAEREEKTARQRQLVGDIDGARQHQDRAEAIKKSLGLPNKLDQEESFQRGLDKSEMLRAIRDNTAELKDANANL